MFCVVFCPILSFRIFQFFFKGNLIWNRWRYFLIKFDVAPHLFVNFLLINFIVVTHFFITSLFYCKYIWRKHYRKLREIPRDNRQHIKVEKNIWINWINFKWCRKGGEDTSNTRKDATNATTSATTSATGAITRSIDTYIYGVGLIAVLAIGAYVFFTYDKKHSQSAKKGQVKERQGQPIKSLKQHNMPQSTILWWKNFIHKWIVLIEKKKIEISIKDGLILTATAMGGVYLIKTL